jgi:hypothetical protein
MDLSRIETNNVVLVRMGFHNNAEIEPAICAFAAAPHGGLVVTGATLFRFEAIKRLALHYRLPLMFGSVATVAEGARPRRIDGASGVIRCVLRGWQVTNSESWAVTWLEYDESSNTPQPLWLPRLLQGASAIASPPAPSNFP